MENEKYKNLRFMDRIFLEILYIFQVVINFRLIYCISFAPLLKDYVVVIGHFRLDIVNQVIQEYDAA